MTPAARQLSTSDARREEVLEAAMGVFAARGFHGTATSEVARAAGISQAYLFKLFPTKGDLAVAVAERCMAKTAARFQEAGQRARAQGLEGDEMLGAIGEAYAELVADPDTLLVQLHSHALAVTDDDVRAAVRGAFARLYEIVRGFSGAPDDAIQAWFAKGMLINVLTALRADEVDADWARALSAGQDGAK